MKYRVHRNMKTNKYINYMKNNVSFISLCLSILFPIAFVFNILFFWGYLIEIKSINLLPSVLLNGNLPVVIFLSLYFFYVLLYIPIFLTRMNFIKKYIVNLKELIIFIISNIFEYILFYSAFLWDERYVLLLTLLNLSAYCVLYKIKYKNLFSLNFFNNFFQNFLYSLMSFIMMPFFIFFLFYYDTDKFFDKNVFSEVYIIYCILLLFIGTIFLINKNHIEYLSNRLKCLKRLEINNINYIKVFFILCSLSILLIMFLPQVKVNKSVMIFMGVRDAKDKCYQIENNFFDNNFLSSENNDFEFNSEAKCYKGKILWRIGDTYVFQFFNKKDSDDEAFIFQLKKEDIYLVQGVKK
ncbi:hypothetical protein ACFFHT_00215 [Gallibacterium melopsittaci]|uniref:Uncharacterized protein n=1 Tax=Gallibacterium melopsittaci TaxID=516063 RepID=A0ABV6HSZ4_9PAST